MERNSFQKNFFTMLTGNTLSQLIPFLFAPILGRLFTREEFGIYGNFLAISGMIGIVASGRLEMAIPIPKANLEAKKILFTGLLITILLTVLSCLIPIFSKNISEFYKDPALESFLWLVPFAVLSFGLVQLANSWVLRGKDYKRLTTSKVAQSLFNNGGAALLGYLGWGLKGMIISWLVSQYISFFTLSFKKNSLKIIEQKYNVTEVGFIVKKYRDFLTINSLHSFLDLFVNQFLIFWIITYYFGQLELGLFTVMVRYLKAPVVLISSSVSQMFYVEANNNIQSNTSVKHIYFKTLKTTALFSLPFAICVYFFAPTFFSVYMGQKWIDAGIYAKIYLPILVMMFFVSPVSSIPILFGKQKQAFLITIFGYSLSLTGFIIGVKLGWNFKNTLLLHTLLYVLLQLFFVVWYYKLINSINDRSC
jgi:lipopolysaccharide exporter